MSKRAPVPERFAKSDVKRASEKQVNWIASMLDYKDLSVHPEFGAMKKKQREAYIAQVKEALAQCEDDGSPSMPASVAGGLIDALKVLPNKAKNASGETKVRGGQGGCSVVY